MVAGWANSPLGCRAGSRPKYARCQTAMLLLRTALTDVPLAGRKRKATTVFEHGLELLDNGITPLGIGVFLGRGNLRGVVPGQEVVNPVNGVIGDIGQHMAQPSLGNNTAQLGRADQRVNGSSTKMESGLAFCFFRM